MNGAVFHTSATMIANRAGHGSAVHRISVPRIWLAMPSLAKMKNHSFAVTAVGIAHGTSTDARSRPRPRNDFAITSAIANPMTVSSATVTTVKKKVLPTEPQNCEPRVPGGHGIEPVAVPQLCVIQRT